MGHGSLAIEATSDQERPNRPAWWTLAGSARKTIDADGLIVYE